MSKEILFDTNAAERMLCGMTKLYEAVAPTFGPKGRNAAFDQKYDVTLVSNDGYAVAKQVEFSDRFEELGASLLREAAAKSNEESGDGTTAAVILTYALVKEAYRSVAAGANPVFLKKGMDKAGKAVTDALASLAVPVKDVKTIRNIAAVAGGNDPEIGDLVARIYEELGFDPVVTLMDSQMAETELEITHGCRIDSGYLSRFFLTDTVRQVCELDDPYIFVCKDEINDINQIFHMLEETVQNNASLVVIARDVRDTAITGLARNVEAGNIRAVALKGPGYSDTRDRNLECIAAVTGATLVDSAYIDITECGLSYCGRAKRIAVEKSTAVIERPACPDSERVETLKRQISEQLRTVDKSKTYETDKLEQSLGLLNSAMASIAVGGTSELEMFERKYRIEDALNAAKRAAADGVVPGGGKALLLCREAVTALSKTLSGDEKTGAEVVLHSLDAPMRLIAGNAGYDAGPVVDTVLKNMNKNNGFNALTGAYGDIVKQEIIDPAAVIRNSFTNAVSTAGMFITAGAAVTESPSQNSSSEG